MTKTGRSRRTGIPIALLLWALLQHAPGHAASSGLAPGYPEHVESMDSREVAMLPGYCRYTQVFRDRVPGGNNPAEIRRWTDTMGTVFNAMHHYCFGLMKTHRAIMIARTPQYRKFYLQSSIEEFDYVLRNAPEGFALLPEILTRRGENLIRLGQPRAGLADLEQAASLKPDYWPPYAVMSDYYRSAGDVTKARLVLSRGLASAPDAKALTSRLAELRARERRATATPAQP